MSLATAGRFFTTQPLGKPHIKIWSPLNLTLKDCLIDDTIFKRHCLLQEEMRIIAIFNDVSILMYTYMHLQNNIFLEENVK